MNPTTTYDPLRRGPYPVGVRRTEVHDQTLADHPVAIEVWYPATEPHRGQDLDDATRDRVSIIPTAPPTAQKAVRNAASLAGPFPLVMYFHGGYGHQSESTHLCSHLASHGYVVAAPAFPGDNIADVLPREDGSATILRTPIDHSAIRRPAQAAAFIEHLVSRASRDLPIDPGRIGTMGVSLGGFTSLAVNSISRRPRAVFAMCPMWGQRSLLPQVRRLARLLRTDDWGRQVSTSILTGQADPMVNADDMRALYRQLNMPKRLFVVPGAGHMHWVDRAMVAHDQFRDSYLSGTFPDPEIDGPALAEVMRPFSELLAEEDGAATARALCLAHFDAEVKNNDAAREYLEHHAPRILADRGIAVEAVGEASPQSVQI